MKKVTLFCAAALFSLLSFAQNDKGDIVKTGDKMPAFTLTSTVNGTVNSADLKGKVVLINIFATWCGPCQQFKPAFDAAAEKFAGQVEFVSVDVDNNPNTAQAFGVTGIPHVVILAPGKNTQNFVGTDELLPQDKFFKLVEDVL